MESASLLRLSAQRALVGAVTPGLRAVSVEYSENIIKWRCIFESEQAKETQWEVLSAAATEVVSDYLHPVTINEEYLVVPSLHAKMEHLASVVFLRYES